MTQLSGVAIRAVAAAVPTAVATTAEYAFLSASERARLAKATGIEARRISPPAQCASDLCAAAAERVIQHLQWTRDSIGALILITQTADQPIPATAIVLQHKLGLSERCVAFDINLGCSGYPFGLAVLGSMMHTLGIDRALLLMGDVSSRVCAPEDKSTWPLFGDAGSATALERDPQSAAMHFDLRSDGAGKDAIIVPSGGLASRRPVVEDMVTEQAAADGFVRRSDNLSLRGADVFSFAISQVPRSIARAMAASGDTVGDVDYLVLHQANKMINDTITRKTGFAPHQALSSLAAYGNTSSASIPLTLCAHAGQFGVTTRLALCGFGVGLSWGTAIASLPAGAVLPVVETDDVY